MNKNDIEKLPSLLKEIKMFFIEHQLIGEECYVVDSHIYELSSAGYNRKQRFGKAFQAGFQAGREDAKLAMLLLIDLK